MHSRRNDSLHPKIIGGESGTGLLYNNYAGQNLVKGRYFGLSRTFGGLQIFDLRGKSNKLIWHDRFPLCSQTGTMAAFGDEFLVMRCCGYAFFDPENPVPTRELKRLAFPGQGELCADIPDDSAISRSLFPKSEWEGQVNVDPLTSKVAGHQHRGRGVLCLHQPDQHRDTRQRHQHRRLDVPRLHRPDQCDNRQRCHQHRGLCVLLLHQPDQYCHPGQRYQHREA